MYVLKNMLCKEERELLEDIARDINSMNNITKKATNYDASGTMKPFLSHNHPNGDCIKKETQEIEKKNQKDIKESPSSHLSLGCDASKVRIKIEEIEMDFPSPYIKYW